MSKGIKKRNQRLNNGQVPKQKSSTALKLVLLGGGIAITAFALKPEEQTSALVFESIEQCTDAGLLYSDCKQSYYQTQQRHMQESPVYGGKGNCEMDFGYQRCQSGEDGLWRPLLAGFMLAKVTDAVRKSMRKDDEQYYSHSVTYGGYNYGGSYPLYRSKDDYFSYRNAKNNYVAPVKKFGETKVGVKTSSYSRFKSTTSATRRGGFGRVAAGRSFGG